MRGEWWRGERLDGWLFLTPAACPMPCLERCDSLLEVLQGGHSFLELGDVLPKFPNLFLATVHLTSIVELAEVLVRVLVTTQ
jgi:hypothetical protein